MEGVNKWAFIIYVVSIELCVTAGFGFDAN